MQGMHGPGAAAMFQQGMPAAMMAMQQQGMMGPGGRGPGGMQMGQGGFMGYPGQPGQPGMGGMDQLGRQMQQMGLGQQQGGQRGGQRGPGGPGAQRGGMRGQQPVQAGAQVGQQAKAQPAAGAGGIEAAGVSVASLAEMTEEQQKNTLGEKLYPLVHSYVGKNLAGKITGMLLEMDVPDLLGLLGDADELKAKVQEAQKVWDAYVKSEAEKQ